MPAGEKGGEWMAVLSQIAADLIMLLHAGFVLFVVFGGVLVLRRPRLARWHLPAALWGAWVEFSDWVCPLTPLENTLRQAAGSRGYPGDFLGRFLEGCLYPEGLTRTAQWGLGMVVVLINGVCYAILWRRRTRKGS